MHRRRAPDPMRFLLALAALSLTMPLAAAGAQGDCDTYDVGLVCVGDYSWTEGDEGCEGDSVHEDGSGLWSETIAGDVSASGFTYCNVYYDSSYHESGIRARADTEAAFLEVSWNEWSYDDPEQHLEGCSFWVYYVGPAYGYYNNVGCPAGDPPSGDWGSAWPDGAKAQIVKGCYAVVAPYVCALDEADGCFAVTAIGAGVWGLAGAAVAGYDACGQEVFVATASAGPTFVNAGWSDGAGGCYAWAYANSLPFLTAPCPPGGMPDPGWGHILP